MAIGMAIGIRIGDGDQNWGWGSESGIAMAIGGQGSGFAYILYNSAVLRLPIKVVKVVRQKSEIFQSEI